VQATAPSSTLTRGASAALVAVGAAPFLAGALLHVDDGRLSEASIPCPFRELTGLPCPLCGSVRGVVLASHLDAGFLSFNAVVVAVLAVLAAVGLAGLLAPRVAGRPLRLPRGRWAVLSVAALAVAAWSWTLANRGTIAG
jgi:hypothetical protein